MLFVFVKRKPGNCMEKESWIIFQSKLQPLIWFILFILFVMIIVFPPDSGQGLLVGTRLATIFNCCFYIFIYFLNRHPNPRPFCVMIWYPDYVVIQVITSWLELWWMALLNCKTLYIMLMFTLLIMIGPLRVHLAKVLYYEWCWYFF